MKLIKALAATAFSAALFAPASFAATKTDGTQEYIFSYDQNYSCSFTQGTKGAFEEVGNSGKIKATVTGMKLTANGVTNISYAASNVSAPTGSLFSMEAGGEGYSTVSGTSSQNMGISNISATPSTGADAPEFSVMFTNGDTPGAYAATVLVTCTYGGGEDLDPATTN